MIDKEYGMANFATFVSKTLTFPPKKRMNLISNRLSAASIKYLKWPSPVFGRFQNGRNKVVIEPRRALTGRRVNYYTPTKERKTDVVLSQVLEGRVIQTLSILKGKNRGTAYIYMYMCVCINIYIYIYTTRIYCKKSCPYSSEWNTPGYQSGPQSGVQILARGTCLRFF